METAVYGGSFNPLHIGHLSILRHLVTLFDKVLLVVTPKNPLKDIDGSSGRQRYEAAVEAVGRHPELGGKVEVCDIEFRLPQPNYSYKTLDALKAMHPEDNFTLVTGGDQIADFRRWKEYAHILLDYGIIVFPREGWDIAAERESLMAENADYRILTVDAPLVDVSSSEIREAYAQGRDISHLLM